MEGLVALVVLIAVANVCFAYMRSRMKSGKPHPKLSPPIVREPVQAPSGNLSPMKTRIRAEQIKGEHHSYLVQRIEAKGLFPVYVPARLCFLASVLDVTEKKDDGEPNCFAVVSSLEDFQEPETTCFQDRQEVGLVERNQGWANWTSVLTVIPETLVPPRKGLRRYRATVLAYDVALPPTVRHGFLLDGKPLASWSHQFTWKHEGDGWLEHGEKRRECEELTVRLAVVMSFADGELHDAEADVIKAWIRRRLEMIDSDRRSDRKQRFNAIVKETYSAAKDGRGGAAKLVARLKEIGDMGARMEAVELCLDILTADGEAADAELKAVNAIAKRLEVDVEQFEALKDKRLVDIAGTFGESVDYYALLNIDRSWGRDQIKTHLNRLYARWNSRAEALSDASARQQAEHMLDVIAAARKALLP